MKNVVVGELKALKTVNPVVVQEVVCGGLSPPLDGPPEVIDTLKLLSEIDPLIVL